jgi:hypothetical protein
LTKEDADIKGIYRTRRKRQSHVFLAESTIFNAGKGVFGRRPFFKGDYITSFSGSLHVAKTYVAPQDRKRGYDLCWNSTVLCQGIQEPMRDHGVGSFINAAPKGGVSNCIPEYHSSGQRLQDSKYFIKATTFIQPKQELFLNYGSGYWKSLKVNKC